jgi:hypothetical protein
LGRHGFYPEFITLAGSNVLVSNFDDGDVEAWNIGGGGGSVLISGLSQPDGTAVSGSALYVVSNSSSSTAGIVGLYDLSGTPTNASFITGLAYPDDVAVYGNNLFVLNYIANTVSEYDATTGALVNASFITGLGNPTHMIACDDCGRPFCRQRRVHDDGRRALERDRHRAGCVRRHGSHLQRDRCDHQHRRRG